VNRARSREGAIPPAESPHRVTVPVNVHRWEDLTFLHWPVAPETLHPLVPDELSVLRHQDTGWVGVTPFFIRVRLPATPTVPGLATFPETNVRTYVAGPDGREGIWFLRMEVSRLWFVLALRALGLPYVWQRMRVDRDGARVSYRSTPHSARSQPGHHVTVRPGAVIDPLGGGDHDRFLTARWGAYHRVGGRLLYTPADHPAWPLHRTEVETCDVASLLAAAGLTQPEDPPIAHFSPGVGVRIGRPQIVG
jgi:uncharacterized protein